MRHERKRYHQRNDCKIDQGASACAPELPLMAKEVYRCDQSEGMDENRAYDGAYANHQWKQDRELMILRHLSTASVLSHHNHGVLDLERIAFGPPKKICPFNLRLRRGEMMTIIL
jgi:hypothetical protein